MVYSSGGLQQPCVVFSMIYLFHLTFLTLAWHYMPAFQATRNFPGALVGSLNEAILTFQLYTLQLCQTDWFHSHMPKSSAPLPPSTAKCEKMKWRWVKFKTFLFSLPLTSEKPFCWHVERFFKRQTVILRMLHDITHLIKTFELCGRVAIGMAVSCLVYPPLQISTSVRCIAISVPFWKDIQGLRMNANDFGDP